MKKSSILFLFLFLFMAYSHAQEYNKVKVITMPDGTRKAIIVKEGEDNSSNTKKSTPAGKQQNTTVTTPANPVPEPQPQSISKDRSILEQEEMFPAPVTTGVNNQQRQYDYFQEIEWVPATYDEKPNFGVALGYEVIPYGGFSDYKHNVNIQLVIQNVVIDGFIGGFGEVTTVFEKESKERVEDKCTWGVNLGYKIRLNDRFSLYPLAGVYSNYAASGDIYSVVKDEESADSSKISDDLFLNYGIGMHYRISPKLFLNYKLTRYTAGIGLGLYFY